MTEHAKKMIAPIVITVLLLLYWIGIAVLTFYVEMPVIVCILAILLPTALGAVMIGVCIQRIKEIRSGEEDDLSKY